MKVCALMSVYNEEDIISESIQNLINNGIDVYVIDNGSTDNTVARIESYLGKGLICIESKIFYENEKPVYNWTELLKHKENLARALNYDWYMHVDADEIRYSPWCGLTLLDAMIKVDAAGFNLINFKLFNFRMTVSDKKTNSVELNMEYFTNAEYFNGKQLKAWKRYDGVDLASEAGHHVKIKNPKVFPIRFILKHYPARTEYQSVKKILRERKDRFTTEEKNKGWHIHYNSFTNKDQILKNIYYDSANLIKFDYHNICISLQNEAIDVLCDFISNDCTKLIYGNELSFKLNWIEHLKLQGFHIETAEIIMDYIFKINVMVNNGQTPEVKIDGISKGIMARILRSLSVMQYSNGNPILYDFINLNEVFIN